MPTINSQANAEPSKKALSLVVAGYSIGAAGLIVLLTANGHSLPSAATVGTDAPVVIGLLVTTMGMIQAGRLARNRAEKRTGSATRGLNMQGVGLVGLLIGTILIMAVSTFTGCLLGAVFITISAALSLAGVLLLRWYFVGQGIAKLSRVGNLIFLGTTTIFSGAGLIAGSKVAFEEYFISQVQKTVYVDIGATISACGCVIAAYSYLQLRNRISWSFEELTKELTKSGSLDAL